MSHAWVTLKSGSNAHSWSQINEDEEGNLLLNSHEISSAASQADQIRIRRKRLSLMDHAQASRRIRRDMIRYVYLILDLSEAIHEKDAALAAGRSNSSSGPPSDGGGGIHRTRLDIILDLIHELVVEYFNQNPLSHLGLVICKNGEAQILSPLSGNKRTAMTAIAAIRDGMVTGLMGRSKKDAGVFSLQNGLVVAGLSLGFTPEYGSREVIVFQAALSTCDPGDILIETLPQLQKARIRVNILVMSAEVHVCKKICEKTGGIFNVAMDSRHLRDLVMGLVIPPPILANNKAIEPTCEFIPMGFPVRETEDIVTLMHSVSGTGKRDSKLFFATGYICPRCKTKANELPVDCAVCGLKLVLAPHLARSFHHLFPVPPFEEVPESKERVGKNKTVQVEFRLSHMDTLHFSDLLLASKLGFSKGNGMKEVVLDHDLLVSSEDCDRCCYSCLKPIGLKIMHDKKRRKAKQSDKQNNNVGCSLRFQCPECKSLFCADCDAFIHETLHNCPGCAI